MRRRSLRAHTPLPTHAHIRLVSARPPSILDSIDVSVVNRTSCSVSSARLSADGALALVPCDGQRRFRHSQYATYLLYNMNDKEVVPWTFSDRKLSLVHWPAKTSALFAFVLDADLYTYTIESKTIKRITDDGESEKSTVLNGINNW